MAITNGYATLDTLKKVLGINASNTANDPQLETSVEAASRQIDAHCRRRFWQDTSTVARTYYPSEKAVLWTDDISTTTGLTVKVDTSDDGTFDTTLTINTDFQVEPVNAAKEYPVQPWTRIRLLDGTLSSFTPLSSGRASVEVTAKFGWSAVPEPVERACLFQAKNIYKAPDLFYGSFQISEEGSPLRAPPMDPIARAMLEPFIRWDEVDSG